MPGMTESYHLRTQGTAHLRQRAPGTALLDLF
jgi:hypothetical protein